MTKMLSENPKVSLQDIKQFEQECDVTLPKQYVDFLLEYNGGFPQESSFKISDDEGESLVNKFYGIGDMKSNLGKVFEVLEGEIPEDFISIANDPAGNEILLGVNGDFQGKVYFWIHDIEPEDEMDNMFILADSFVEFFNNLYESE
ncbi:SMI1/KNR4 family protein [Bacillus pseudomycoides]|uniref:SMI1/KNR4 family protein n=1 Tax=Bacillus pseudomycoides TaxID=64104 RepID=A0A2A8C7T1_9BACI|nr:SMI1/KNR4 family protein [Bacillus pseudomycoides]PDY47042.1 SMI1/KNR4 family protein [Bacillus pseudomycoides]PEA83722.1 SMI1/KNR4 family protein [Bacillus pseudomycoides]PED05141.1 SMI1/KNR4 family protein [Bacillus pseudomycoides]PED73515.1 SMI1/KNR4 family protein [Bacillus pseudomycoides]PEI38939.1 SMI1/KNR4 family protein [Bacillus pseudomycoides]